MLENPPYLRPEYFFLMARHSVVAEDPAANTARATGRTSSSRYRAYRRSDGVRALRPAVLLVIIRALRPAVLLVIITAAAASWLGRYRLSSELASVPSSTNDKRRTVVLSAFRP